MTLTETIHRITVFGPFGRSLRKLRATDGTGLIGEGKEVRVAQVQFILIFFMLPMREVMKWLLERYVKHKYAEIYCRMHVSMHSLCAEISQNRLYLLLLLFLKAELQETLHFGSCRKWPCIAVSSEDILAGYFLTPV